MGSRFLQCVMRSCATLTAKLRGRSARSSTYSTKREEPQKTRLAYLVATDRLVLNLQVKEGEFKQFEISQAQLAGIVTEGVRVLLGNRRRRGVSSLRFRTHGRNGSATVDASKPKAPSEHKIQVTLLDYLKFAARSDCYYFAIPNQSNRHIANAVKMKAEGVRSGIADLCFMLPNGKVCWLEMKKPGGSLSDNQKQFREVCSVLKHEWGTAKSVEEALDLLTGLGC